MPSMVKRKSMKLHCAAAGEWRRVKTFAVDFGPGGALVHSPKGLILVDSAGGDWMPGGILRTEREREFADDDGG